MESKLYARRGGEPQALERNRLVSGIHAIQKKLRMSDGEYRQILVQAVGKTSTKDMDIDELDRVFKQLRYLQGLAEAEWNL